MNGTTVYLIAIFLLALMDMSAKWLTDDYSVPQIMLFRALFAFIPILLLVKVEKTPVSEISLKTGSVTLQLLRGVAVSVTVGAFFAALKYMPLADVVAVSLMGPILMVILAYYLLGEGFVPQVLIYVLVGMVGVLIIIRPSGEISLIGGLFAFVSACFYAVAAVLTKKLTKTDSTLVTSIYTNLTLTVFALFWLTGVEWTPFTGLDLAICLLMGLAGGASNILFVVAFKLSEVSLVAVLDYTIYIWAVLFGILFFSEMPDIMALVGAALIMLSGYLVSRTKKTK